MSLPTSQIPASKEPDANKLASPEKRKTIKSTLNRIKATHYKSLISGIVPIKRGTLYYDHPVSSAYALALRTDGTYTVCPKYLLLLRNGQPVT